MASHDLAYMIVKEIFFKYFRVTFPLHETVQCLTVKFIGDFREGQGLRSSAVGTTVQPGQAGPKVFPVWSRHVQ